MLKKYKVLVICTGNSARSIMVEALFNTVGESYFEAVSAGSHPTGKVNPFALEEINNLNINFEPTSKNWNVFVGEQFDFVITVCGNAAQEICPCFAGEPLHIHWGDPDPAAVEGDGEDKRKAFSDCFDIFSARIARLIGGMKSQQSDLDTDNVMKAMLALANT
ncbi:MAG: arsenate reductase ArsC [Methylophaga sp.]|nr:arsenate reductase ArsC [Methylophaga sp.]